jgi:hypothetical protein
VLSAKYGPITKKEAKNSDWVKEIKDDMYDYAISSIARDIQKLVDQKRISSAMLIDQFLNPKDEKVYDNEEVHVDDIIHAYSTEERAYETEEEDVVVEKIAYQHAISALQTLRLYEEQQDQSDSEAIT